MIIVTAVAALGLAVAADAAAPLNTYTSSLRFTGNPAGSALKPRNLAVTAAFTMGGTGGNRTAPVSDIKATIYGLVSYGQFFPMCSLTKIADAKNDNVCPPGALVASGTVAATVGPTDDQSAGASGQLPCDPIVHVWNAGLGKLVFFLVEDATHQCANGAITTGSVPPWPGTGNLAGSTGTLNSLGKWLVVDVPIPNYVDYPISGIEASIESIRLTFSHAIKHDSHGATYEFIGAVGCQHGQRPWNVAITAAEPGGTPVTQTQAGTQRCTR
jgi:hypothetical protein